MSIEEISRECYDNMGKYNQITIDYTQETEELLNESFERGESDEEIRDLITNLGVLSYDITVLLEVINPELQDQISILKNLNSLINIRLAKIDAVTGVKL